MNCRGCRQRFLPLPDLSRKIEGDSVRRVVISIMYSKTFGKKNKGGGLILGRDASGKFSIPSKKCLLLISI